MDKIILISKLDRNAEEIYKGLYRQYSVQFCTEAGENLQNMMRIIRPSLVIYQLSADNGMEKDVFDILLNFYTSTPVIVLGTREECEKYSQYFMRENITLIYRPVNIVNVLEKCNFILYGKKAAEELPYQEEKAKSGVLIVDDSAVTLRSVKALLDSKYKVWVATSGEMALRLMQKNIPDLILLDYEMPECDGKQTLEIIRKDENLKDIPVIFLTGVADKQRIASILELNPAGYLLKPTEKDRLLGKIEEVLKK